jgi:hypothetical protein
MLAAETTQGLADLSIHHDTTLPYSPHQNGKQEVYWSQAEGRLMAMLEGVEDLTLELLNDATQAWAELEYNRALHSELGGASPLERFMRDRSVGLESPSPEELRRAFRAKVCRTQRRSDGTVSIFGCRFEVPSRFRHLERLSLRIARWDLSAADLVDERSNRVLATLWPLDKTRNADARRRAIPDGAARAGTESSATLASGMAPLLKELMAQYAATGLPPAYIPQHDPQHDLNEEETL